MGKKLTYEGIEIIMFWPKRLESRDNYNCLRQKTGQGSKEEKAERRF